MISAYSDKFILIVLSVW